MGAGAAPKRGSLAPEKRPRSNYHFPSPDVGVGPEGVIGVGADLEPGTVLEAYHQGIFPWPSGRRGTVLWCSPNPRAILPLGDEPHWSRSLRRSLRVKPFRITIDEAFGDVMD